MKKIICLIILVAAFSILFAGCTTIQASSKNALTAGIAKTEIIKGQTIQNEILEIFGSPNIITKNKSGNEVWTYDKISVEKSAVGGFGVIIIAGGRKDRSIASTRTFILMIEFDDNEVVRDYSYRSSAF